MGTTSSKTKTDKSQPNHLNSTTSHQIPPNLSYLIDACVRKDVHKIMMIIKQHSDLINEVVDYDDALLMMSCKEGWYAVVEYLISNHSNTININQLDKDGKAALYYAVSKGYVNCVTLLLSHPMIDVNIQYNSEFNKTVLWYCRNRVCYDLLLPHYPTTKDHEKRMAWLYSMYYWKIGGVEEVKGVMKDLSYDVLYEMRDDMGMLLWWAVDRGDEEMIEYLISYSNVININIQDKYSSHTPLHRAVASNRVNCIYLLMNQPNIDMKIRDKEGKTAYGIGKVETKRKMKLMFLLHYQKLVRWNRSKIMLVGQGRAGKTALANNLAGRWMGESVSTIGAEQMDMRLLSGGEDGWRLVEYERPKRELEALLAELSYYKDTNRKNSFSLSPFQPMTVDEDANETSSKLNPQMSSPNVMSTSAKEVITGLSIIDQIITGKKDERGEEDIANFPPIKLNDIKLNEADLHYFKLQEDGIPSNYKLLLVDFGGQSIFDVLNGFFISRYGVYLVVFDMELFVSRRASCSKQLKFWLNLITMHTFDSASKTAPVAIVGTRGDKVRKDEDHEKISSELVDMFGDMKVWESLMWYERGSGKGRLSFFPNNNKRTKNNAVSQELLRSIDQNLGTADYMKRETPMLWIKMLDEMKGLDCCYLLYEEVLRMMQVKYQDRGSGDRMKEGDSKNLTRKSSIEMEVREMLRYLNDMGMLMWIERKGLEDVVILDPIEDLMKPAAIIFCNHIATKDDPYRTIHEIPEIHGENQREFGEDWSRMLEYGVVSEVLVRALLKRYYDYQLRLKKLRDKITGRDERSEMDKVLLFLVKYGLMVQSSTMYFIPSLVPPDPSMIFADEHSTIPQDALSRLCRRQAIQSFQLSKSCKFSLLFHLSDSTFFVHDVVSCMELHRKGFLPSGLFERLLGTITRNLIEKVDGRESFDKLFRDDKRIIAFQDKIQLLYNHHVVRLSNRLEENRIEVEMELHDEEDMREEEKQEEREMMARIYEHVIEIIERQVLSECYSSLQVLALIPLPDLGADLTEERGKVKGFIPLTRVRSLLSIADSSLAERETRHLMSEDGKCLISLNAKAMKKDAYWSVWKEKVNIPTLPAVSSSRPDSPFFTFSSLCPPALVLPEGKKTHVFLSHDWGIDGDNHLRVKQVSEALKSRGLVTWIDDERLVNEIDEKIIDGIDHTECMLVFMTQSYVRKVNGGNDSDYCKREFKYGCSRLGVDRLIVVVLDEAMKDSSKWHGLIKFNLGSVLYYDLSTIFEALSCESEESVNELMDGLYEKIFIAITGRKPEKQSEESNLLPPSISSHELIPAGRTIEEGINSKPRKTLSETLKFIGLFDSINDEQLTDEIDQRIIDAIDSLDTLAFATERCERKVIGQDGKECYEKKCYHMLKAVSRKSISHEEIIKTTKSKDQDNQGNKLENEEGNSKEIVEKIQVKQILKFLNDMGMLMWIEDTGLEDVIILDPIEDLVKPATIIICKHFATKDDPYRTIHEIPEIHGESKKQFVEDWNRMLEYGVVSEVLVRNIIKSYLHLIDSRVMIKNYDKVLLLLMRLSLMAALFPSTSLAPGNSYNKDVYAIPSLLSDDSLSSYDSNDDESAYMGENNSEEDGMQKMFTQLTLSHSKIEEQWHVGMHFSLFCFVPINLLSIPKSSDVVSTSELSKEGFLPSHFFELFVSKYSGCIGGLLSSSMLLTNRSSQAGVTYQHLNLRFNECSEEKRIEVVFRSHPDADQNKAKKVFQDIYYIIVEITEALLNEANEGLKVKTLIHFPSERTNSCQVRRGDGYVTLSRVRRLLSVTDEVSDEGDVRNLKQWDLTSCDKKLEITLIPTEMKKEAYWSVWNEKEKIPNLYSNSSSFSSLSPPAVTLPEWKKTHVSES